MKRFFILVLVTFLAWGTLSRCYGSFALTRSLHGWVGSVENRWLRSILFFVIAVWPLPIVYGVCILADGIVLNSVEFWSGENPMQGSAAYDQRGEYRTVLRDGQARADFIYRDYGETLEIRLTQPGEATRSMFLKRNAPGVIYVERDGRLVPVEVQDVPVGDVTALRVTENGRPVGAYLIAGEQLEGLVASSSLSRALR